MKNIKSNCCYRLAFLLPLLGLAAVSCSKKSESRATSEAAPAPEPPPAAAAAASPAMQPTQDTAAMDARIAEARAALKAKDYERAAAAITVPARTAVPMTGQQLMSLNSTKADVINQISAAAASGDAKAKAAYEAMRRHYMEK